MDTPKNKISSRNQHLSEKLRHRMFVGSYQERKFIEAIQEYRDVVSISNLESDLKKDLQLLRSDLLSANSSNAWIGISDISSHCNLWVKLDNLAFGHYWFQIRKIKLTEKEISLSLKCISPYRMETESKTSNYKPQIADEAEESSDKVDWETLVEEWKQFLTKTFVSCMRVQNVIEVVRFIFAVLVMLVTALLHFVQYFGDYSIRLFRELSHLIHVLTPLFLAIIEFISKCVGGFYILLAMVFNGFMNRNRPLAAPHSQVRPSAPRPPVQALPWGNSAYGSPPRNTMPIYREPYNVRYKAR